jgi:putative SOS response-associated peptidase YedK
MCGRMTQQRDPSEIARIFDAEIAAGDATALAELGPRYNVAPTEPVTVVVQHDDGRRVELHRWGLVPAWSEKPTTRSPLINARAETIAASPAFRTSFVRRRCVIPADGFYEWRREGRRRQPFLIRPPATTSSTPLLAFAGIWAPWRDPATGEWLLSSAVVTTAANATVGRLHDRMPVILDADAWRLWLDPTVTDAGLLHDLLRPTDDVPLEDVPVSPLVNNANNKGPELIVPLEDVAPPESAARPLTLFS